ncbi:DUF3082 domain-containing protein [[Phormidium] sp. ETS-05]|uniref:DUF3082 domain-containing protein n=1 Tax=[Phormidium] sp. ETS-05 TaxID=222819 RepID=UPI0018EF105F|nr:DUF3082 domain-containing protein [[Phormidium] sp. ETS-05]
MTNDKEQTTIETPPTVGRALSGAAVSAGIAFASYCLTSSIAQTFANKPIESQKLVVQNIGAAVRTLVVGISALATFVFAFAALGLFALSIQLLLQSLKTQPQKDGDSG